MPENKQIHDLPIAEQTSSSDLFETEIPSQLMQSGYASRKVSAAEIADLLLNDMTYPQALQTTAKKIIPAINEAAQSGGGGGALFIQKTMAEYTALPSSEKMNGSIYKITDKALIYCLDEAYHAVLEITSADYALLTSDEKNNGTLYVITDEETTAADIEYTSGVSVADKLDSLSTPIVDVDGTVITISHIDNIYTVGMKGCPVSSLYQVMANYTTSKFLRFVAWNFTSSKPVIISIGENTVYVIDASTWQVLPNTNNDQIHGGITYIKT